MEKPEVEINVEFDADKASEEIKQTLEHMRKTVKEIYDKCARLQKEVKHCRNELCLKCGMYKERYLSPCNDCRFRHGGEWSVDLDD